VYAMKKLQLLGTGCPKCKKLAEIVEDVAKSMNMEYELVKITDISEIMSFGVMMTPALAVDGEVKVFGRIPKPEEIRKMIA